MSDQPEAFFDLEFCFKNGTILSRTLKDGRDTAVEGEAVITLFILDEPGRYEEVTIDRSEVAYMSRTRREVQPETHTEDGGSIRLIGGVNGR